MEIIDFFMQSVHSQFEFTSDIMCIVCAKDFLVLKTTTVMMARMGVLS
jgi:hypothetical protein